MVKRLIHYALFFIKRLCTKPLTVTVIRRYTISGGNVGELYGATGKIVCDSVDTFPKEITILYAIAQYEDFVQLRPANTLRVNDKTLDGKLVLATVVNRWVDEW